MLQELIDAVNAYRLEHSACEASGRKSAELNDTYVRMLQACDAAATPGAVDLLHACACGDLIPADEFCCLNCRREPANH